MGKTCQDCKWFNPVNELVGTCNIRPIPFIVPVDNSEMASECGGFEEKEEG